MLDGLLFCLITDSTLNNYFNNYHLIDLASSKSIIEVYLFLEIF